MANFTDRITKIFKDARKSQQEFADSVGISEKTFRNYRDGLTLPTLESLANISKYYNVDCNWLVLGEGPIYRDQTPAPQPSQVKDTSINLLGLQTIKKDADNSTSHEDMQKLLAQLADMQKTILDLTTTNRQLVEKLLAQ